jgi:NADH-quinone oxidoreductase subunit K
LGLYTVLTRKNAIGILMGLELMLNAVNINLVAFGRYITPQEIGGQIFAIFVIVIAAAEAAVALAIIIAAYRQRQTINVEDFDAMQF